MNYNAAEINLANRLIYIRRYVLEALKNGKLIRTKGRGIAGSFRFPDYTMKKPQTPKRKLNKACRQIKANMSKKNLKQKNLKNLSCLKTYHNVLILSVLHFVLLICSLCNGKYIHRRIWHTDDYIINIFDNSRIKLMTYSINGALNRRLQTRISQTLRISANIEDDNCSSRYEGGMSSLYTNQYHGESSDQIGNDQLTKLCH